MAGLPIAHHLEIAEILPFVSTRPPPRTTAEDLRRRWGQLTS